MILEVATDRISLETLLLVCGHLPVQVQNLDEFVWLLAVATIGGRVAGAQRVFLSQVDILALCILKQHFSNFSCLKNGQFFFRCPIVRFAAVDLAQFL